MKAREPSNTTSHAVLSAWNNIDDKLSITYAIVVKVTQFTILYLGQIGLHGDGQTVGQGEVDRGGELASAEL